MTLSTHVLDNATGEPARGVPVRLERRDGDGWATVAAGRTDTDGRVRDWALSTGAHRLVFDTAAHSAFFPEVAVVFQVDDAGRHYHVPLLLSPYGYTTYRGS